MALVPIRRRPTAALMRFPDMFEEMVSRFLGGPEVSLFGGGGWCPALDITERDDEVVVEVELPGLKLGDIDLSVEGNLLTISGQKKESSERKEENYYHAERRYGTFRRTITLPVEVEPDKIEARHEDGVLIITLPKAAAAKPRKIPIKQ